MQVARFFVEQVAILIAGISLVTPKRYVDAEDWLRSVRDETLEQANKHLGNVRRMCGIFNILAAVDPTEQRGDWLKEPLKLLSDSISCENDELSPEAEFAAFVLWPRFGQRRVARRETTSTGDSAIPEAAPGEDHEPALEEAAFEVSRSKTKKENQFIRIGTAASVERGNADNPRNTFRVDPIGVTNIDIQSRAVDVTLRGLRHILQSVGQIYDDSQKNICQECDEVCCTRRCVDCPPNCQLYCDPCFQKAHQTKAVRDHRSSEHTIDAEETQIEQFVNAVKAVEAKPLEKGTALSPCLRDIVSTRESPSVSSGNLFEHWCETNRDGDCGVMHYLTWAPYWADPRFLGEFLRKQGVANADCLIGARDHQTHQLSLLEPINAGQVRGCISKLYALLTQVCSRVGLDASKDVCHHLKALCELDDMYDRFQDFRRAQRTYPLCGPEASPQERVCQARETVNKLLDHVTNDGVKCQHRSLSAILSLIKQPIPNTCVAAAQQHSHSHEITLSENPFALLMSSENCIEYDDDSDDGGLLG
eukprot:TRINITY_DN1433_c0_g1_i1.p1 TRINITY_DN1433_c0_g1~~TRINITY_DN1433_c0_g1_i1.p1  ORF type:complete len:534 (+),score=37.30 TRINITY_DN1433_c0_g1_i1:448-2049(+)